MLSSRVARKPVLFTIALILMLSAVFAVPRSAQAQGTFGCPISILMYDSLILRTNPSWGSAVSVTLRTGESVCLTARNADTTWLQVSRPGGAAIGWGPTTAFWASVSFNILPVVGTTPTPPPTPPTPPPTTGQTYVVQWGDNLFRIAQRFGVTTQALAAANNVLPPYYTIYAGQVLVIPTGTTTPPPTGYTTYTVQRGEYLVSIAARFRTDWRTLATLNNIPWPYTIYTGQVLMVPMVS